MTVDLAQQIAEHEAAARAARALLEEQHAAELQRQQEQIEQSEAAFLQTWQQTAATMEEEERAARRRFEQAVLDSPIFDAWIAYRAGRWRRTHLIDEVTSVMNRNGLSNPPAMLEYRTPRLIEDVIDVTEREARGRALEEADERQQARSTT